MSGKYKKFPNTLVRLCVTFAHSVTFGSENNETQQSTDKGWKEAGLEPDSPHQSLGQLVLLLGVGEMLRQEVADELFVVGIEIEAEGWHEALERHDDNAANGAFVEQGEGAKIIVRIKAAADLDAVFVDDVLQLARRPVGDHGEENGSDDANDGVENVMRQQKDADDNQQCHADHTEEPAG